MIDHISLIDVKDKKVLLCRSKGKTKWQLPGGKREEGETDEQALIRECKEELKVNVKAGSSELFETIEGQAYGKDDGVMVRIKIFKAEFEGEIVPGSEIEEAKYMNYGEIPDTSEMGWEYLQNLKKRGIID